MTIYVLSALASAIGAAMLVYGLLGRQSLADHAFISQLRLQLQEKAQGRLTEEEFAKQQIALHAEVLQPLSAGRGLRAVWIGAGAVCLAAAAVLLVRGSGAGTDTTAAAPPDSVHTQNPMGMGTGKPAGDLNTLADRLAGRLAKEPGNGQGLGAFGAHLHADRTLPGRSRCICKSCQAAAF